MHLDGQRVRPGKHAHRGVPHKRSCPWIALAERPLKLGIKAEDGHISGTPRFDQALDFRELRPPNPKPSITDSVDDVRVSRGRFMFVPGRFSRAIPPRHRAPVRWSP